MKNKTIIDETSGPVNFAMAEEKLKKLAVRLRGRNRSVLTTQLQFGLWLLVAKKTARDWQRTSKNNQRPSPVKALNKMLDKKHPTLPRRRMRDMWSEAALAVIIAENLITLPVPLLGQRQPKPEDLDQLRQITFAHWEKITTKYETMANVRELLLGKGKKLAAKNKRLD